MIYSVIVPRGTPPKMMDEIRRGIESWFSGQVQVSECGREGPIEPYIVAAENGEGDSRVMASMKYAAADMLGVPEGYSVREMAAERPGYPGHYEYLMHGDDGRLYIHEDAYDTRSDANLAAWRDAQNTYARQDRSYRAACEQIFQLMDGEEWNADTLEAIGAVLTRLGYRLDDLAER